MSIEPVDEYNNAMGAHQPAHILNSSRRHKTMTEIHEKYPNHILVSGSFMYKEFWKFFRKHFKLDTLPPPLIMDNTKHYPHGTSWNGSETWCAAFYNSSHAYTTNEEVDGETLPSDFVITEHEIRVYNRAVRKDLEFYFDNAISPWVAHIYLCHIFAHELCHFLDSLKRQNTLLDLDPESKEYIQRIKDINHRVAHETFDEGFAVEKETEALAVEMFTKFMLDYVHGDKLGTILHGPMDDYWYKVKGMTTFHESLLLIRFFELKYQTDFCVDHDSAEYDEILKVRHNIQIEIVECAKFKKLKYFITD